MSCNAVLDAQENIPDILYRFYSLSSEPSQSVQDLNESKFDALKKNEIWMSAPVALNDPFELATLYIDYGKGYPKEICDYFSDKLNECRKNVRIASFSENDFSSMLMWAYYANNHQGFCVEYKVQKKTYIQKVTYLSKRYGLINSVIRYFWEEMNQQERREFEELLSITNRTKGIEWQNEREFRVILSADEIRQISDVGGLVSLESVGLIPMRIILGMKCSESHKRRLMGIGKTLGCPVASATMSNNEYKMVVKCNE